MSKERGVSSYTHTQRQLDDYANQNNPNNHAYWDNLDNHANQCNPNNDAYYGSRQEGRLDRQLCDGRKGFHHGRNVRHGRPGTPRPQLQEAQQLQ